MEMQAYDDGLPPGSASACLGSAGGLHGSVRAAAATSNASGVVRAARLEGGAAEVTSKTREEQQLIERAFLRSVRSTTRILVEGRQFERGPGGDERGDDGALGRSQELTAPRSSPAFMEDAEVGEELGVTGWAWK